MGRILPGDITRPFEARRAQQIGRRDSFATRVSERALGSFLTPQGVATGVKLIAPFIKMGGEEEGLTESALGLSPAAEVAAKRVTPPAAPTTAGPTPEEQAIDRGTRLLLARDKQEEENKLARALDAADRMRSIQIRRRQRQRGEQEGIDALTQQFLDEGFSTDPVTRAEAALSQRPPFQARLAGEPEAEPTKQQVQLKEPVVGLTATPDRPDVVGKIYKKSGGVVFLNTQVRRKLVDIASKTGGDVNELIKALIPESSLDTTKVQPDSGASGLIQFTTIALNDMKRKNLIPKNLKLSDIRKMGALEQLDLAEKYFLMHKSKADYSNPGEYSVAIFGPAALGKDRSTVLYRKAAGKKGDAYRQNINVDSKDPKKRKGFITVGDYLDFKDQQGRIFRRTVGEIDDVEMPLPELAPIPAVAGAEAEAPETEVSGLEEQTETIALPVDTGESITAEKADEMRLRALQRRSTAERLGIKSRPLPEELPDDQVSSEPDATVTTAAPAAPAATTPGTQPTAGQEEAMLRALAKTGSLRDQQRYIEGALKRGDLGPSQVQALTMAAGLVRERLQPRTLAEALFAAERGSTVGDLWYDKTMQGVSGRVASGDGLTAYQRQQIALRASDKTDKEKAQQRKMFRSDVRDMLRRPNRILTAYNKLKAQNLLEGAILSNAPEQIANIRKYERQMRKLLRDAANPKADIQALNKKYLELSEKINSESATLQSAIVGAAKQGSEDRVAAELEAGNNAEDNARDAYERAREEMES